MGFCFVAPWNLCWPFCGLYHILSNGCLYLNLTFPLDCGEKASRSVWLLLVFRAPSPKSVTGNADPAGLFLHPGPGGRGRQKEGHVSRSHTSGLSSPSPEPGPVRLFKVIQKPPWESTGSRGAKRRVRAQVHTPTPPPSRWVLSDKPLGCSVPQFPFLPKVVSSNADGSDVLSAERALMKREREIRSLWLPRAPLLLHLGRGPGDARAAVESRAELPPGSHLCRPPHFRPPR